MAKQLNPIVAVFALRALGKAMAVVGVCLGLNIIIRAEWDSSPIYQTALLVPGSPPVWGAVLLAVSMVMCVGYWHGYRRVIAWGHWASSVWCIFFGLSMLYTALVQPTVPTGGVWTYLALATAHLLLGNAYHSSWDME